METLRVLAVDDEMGMRLGVERALRGFTFNLPEFQSDVDFSVTSVETGEEALEKIQQAPPDILLLDHKLPGMSGLDVLEKIPPENDKLITIMITAYASLETAVTAIKRGAYDFLAKPFTPNELKAAVRRAAESLVVARQARQLAREKRQVRFQFISVLAHELKAPLGAIEGYLRIIKDGAAGDDPAAYDRMIERSLVRLEGMRKMIMDLLDLTRIESGQKKRELTEVDLVEFAQTAIETFLPDAQQRDITIELHADENLVVAGDRSEIEIIFNNLISNAVKYNKDGGRVDVNLSADEETATISVADTGIGMTQEEANKLFNDFVRLKNPKTRNILGSGLGLAILKKITQMYQGDVRVESQPDVGSTFTVKLKRHASAEDAAEAEAADVHLTQG